MTTKIHIVILFNEIQIAGRKLHKLHFFTHWVVKSWRDLSLRSHVTWCTGFGFLDILLDNLIHSDYSSLIHICGILNSESHMATVNSLLYLTVSMPLFCGYMQMDCQVMWLGAQALVFLIFARFFDYSDNSSLIDICEILNSESHMAIVNSLIYLTVSMPLFCPYMQMDCHVMWLGAQALVFSIFLL